jgi:hypothetical protein
LKFTKVSITYLDFIKDPSLTSLILSHVFALKNSKKYSMTLRRIITKLIIRVGTDRVRQATAKEHIPLVSYVERCRRKKQNARERTKLLALLGQKLKSKDEQKEDESELDSDSEGEVMPNDQALDSDSSDYSDSESDDDVTGTDQLQSSVKLDIPVVYDIPIVS